MKWIRKIFGKGPEGSAASSDAPAEELVGEDRESDDDSDQYFSDEPITSKHQDRFGRAPYAARIAETIARRLDPSSIVIGLFGPWGDGKTSVLKMMEESLDQHGQVVTIRFNPWHFPSEDALLRGFFATLAEALGKEPAFKEKAAALLESYGGILSVISVALPGVEINPGEAAKQIGESLSKVSLDKLKDQIDALLGQSGKRLVILIDDIDRLDRQETHAIFKLVKLSASFKYTCYVLAFDDEVVAAALGERYGAGGQEAGRAFLEKIIQVPLHLPPADQMSLREIAFEGVEHALNQAGIVLDQRQIDVFTRHFVDGLEPKLETPRVAKLYTNALMFALPLVKGEVNIAEFMLVEGLRVLYPKLHAEIRDNADLFLQGEPREALRGLEKSPSAIDRLLETAMPGSTSEERGQMRERLLKPLFPRISSMMYGGDWEERWGNERRICSSRYFKRYFVYGVPEGDISDNHLTNLIDALVTADTDSQRSLLSSYSKRVMPQLIQALRNRADSLDEVSALAIAIAVARNGDLLPRERGALVIGGTIMYAGILISQLIRRIPLSDRQSAAEAVLGAAFPLAMGMECARWLTHSADRPEERRVLPDGADDALYHLFAVRIRDADDVEPLFMQAGRDAPNLYWYWQHGRNREEIEARLRELFDKDPAKLDDFLDTYIGEGWEVESGLPVRSDLRRESYNSIASIISPNYVFDNLRTRYGAELDAPQYYQNGEPARITAHQFASIHLSIVAEQLPKPQDADGSGSDPEQSE
ncbi:putative KAP-like P-loop ATPase [Pseudomonas protegens]|uniref:KAP family P-loop NTPase fold protein n=1 Tax=Pseudomonas TaxID=286 RepID=UPI000BFE003D|nr:MULTISPECIES: P-loop NTPase fold protein [Pseudomonas]ATN10610.1 NTPase KAP [Pseudomonas sp. FDAARGOS_380]AZE69366.1 Chromosome partition protein smc [Pseudomonas synxantha]MDT3418384.1 putative KAP-like P-loop ATPase [Pseudomonas protegens]